MTEHFKLNSVLDTASGDSSYRQCRRLNLVQNVQEILNWFAADTRTSLCYTRIRGMRAANGIPSLVRMQI